MAEPTAPVTDTSTPDSPEAGAGVVAAPAPIAEPAKPDAGGFIWGTGRRKSSVARVRIRPGEGTFQINGREVDNYFSEPQHRNACLQPLSETNTQGKLDIFVKVHGGGITGQAGAILLGVARALKAYDPSLEPILRDHDYLSRDPRRVERKKYGQPGARAKFQFSKR
ncbi:MAG: 30S ribosomal protein S9 [Phycisphaeraceae bacterium]